MSHRKFTDLTRLRSNTANLKTKACEKQKHHCLPKMQPEQWAKFDTVTFALVNKIEIRYEASCLKREVERGSTFTSRDLHTFGLSFVCQRKFCARTHVTGELLTETKNSSS